MLAAIYYGTMYGGTITSVLMNGRASRARDHRPRGYPMANKGRAGAALTSPPSARSSPARFATVGMIVLTGPLSRRGAQVRPA